MATVLVAVVEDDLNVLESLESLLESAGYRALLYASGEDFLVSNRLWDIDCLISDVGLPGISGLELLRLVHSGRPELPIIIITARDEPNLLQVALDAGARRAFMKPIDNADLLNAIASIS